MSKKMEGDGKETGSGKETENEREGRAHTPNKAGKKAKS
jgi:hypothetical protein